MRILKEKLKVRIRASGFNTINEGQLCCFVLFFLLNLFLTAQNINGFYFLDPDDVGLYGPYLYLFFFYLYSIHEYYLKDFYFVLFCFSSRFVFDSTKHPRFLLFRSGWCWPMSILYEHFGDKIPLHWTELRKKKCWVNDVFGPYFLYHILILCLTFQLCQFSSYRYLFDGNCWHCKRPK